MAEGDACSDGDIEGAHVTGSGNGDEFVALVSGKPAEAVFLVTKNDEPRSVAFDFDDIFL